MGWSEFGSLMFRAGTRRADYALVLSCLNVFNSIINIMLDYVSVQENKTFNEICVINCTEASRIQIRANKNIQESVEMEKTETNAHFSNSLKLVCSVRLFFVTLLPSPIVLKVNFL